MFDGWGRLVYRRRRLVLVIALIVVAFAAAWGTGVFGKLQSSGGFTPPNSQSQQAGNLATAAFGRDTGDVVVLYSSPTMSVRSPGFRAAVTHTLAGLPASRVESTATYWSTGSPQFVSASGRATYAVLELTGTSDAARQTSYNVIKSRLDAPGLRTEVGGLVPTNEAINKQVTSDIGRAEAFSLPVLLIVMLIIFGSLAAASLPLAIGGVAILGSFTVLRLLTLATTVSIYSVTISTILGLGLGIDYGLFMVSSRSAVNEPRIATPPIASGRLAAARLPKMNSMTISSTGREKASARPMSELTSLLIASFVGTSPPTSVRRPGAPSWPLIAS